MNTRHAEREQMAQAAHQECRAIAQAALDAIAVRVGWWIRSDAQKRRYANAKREVKK